MCAASNLTNPKPPVSTKPLTTSKPIPKWLKMKQQNKSSAGKQTAKPIAKQSLSSAQQKPNVNPKSEGTRNEKRSRWAKQSRPKPQPVKTKEPINVYISVCCSEPARKPRAGMKEAVKDAETGKVKDKPKGLGHWRCGKCGKTTKVTVGKVKDKENGERVVSKEQGEGQNVQPRMAQEEPNQSSGV